MLSLVVFGPLGYSPRREGRYTESRTVGSSLDVSVDEEERNIESEYSEHLPRWAIVPSYINTFKGPNVIQPQS
jgi:hypothetical protein